MKAASSGENDAEALNLAIEVVGRGALNNGKVTKQTYKLLVIFGADCRLNLYFFPVNSISSANGMNSSSDQHHHLSRQLIDYLLGETDGVPKDAKYLFRY